jgi:micrococcal nuclease
LKQQTFFIGLVLVATITVLSSCGQNSSPAGLGTVVGVIDGDTVAVALGDTTESVRLLGIDTPETVHPNRPPECFGKEASARLALLLPPGTAVLLHRDVEPRDHYGRLLAYLERLNDGLNINLVLVEQGFAASLHIEPNDGMRRDLEAAESRARADQRGLWAVCNGNHVPLEEFG